MARVRIPRSRVRAWLDALRRVEATAWRLAAGLGRVTVLLHGSYARGDFNVWSDVDVIVVSEAFEGIRFLDRYDRIAGLLEPGVEAVPLTPGELAEALGRPSWRQALARGVVVVIDDYGVSELLERVLGFRPPGLGDLRARVERLLGEAVDL